MKLITFLLFIFMSFNAHSEYRVYQYILKNKVPTNQEASDQFIISTLDPVSYMSYHGGQTLVQVDLLRTWICPGHTADRKICDSPYGQIPQGILP